MKRKKRIGTVGKAIGCLFFLMVSLFPIYWLVAMAIRPTDEMRGHIALIPQSLTGIHFAELFSAKNFGTAIINSLQTTFGSLFVSLVVGICAAYIIARRRFRFGLKKPMTYWVLLVRVLPPVAFTIPLYIMFNKLGILNTKLPVLLACVLINVPLIIWFLISFFQDLPEEVEESAKVDGATEWQTFLMIAIPLSGAIIAVMALYAAVGTWGSWYTAFIYITDQKKWPLQLRLRQILILDSTQSLDIYSMTEEDIAQMQHQAFLMTTVKYAIIFVACLPMLVLYPFVQKYFVKGVMIGSVKG